MNKSRTIALTLLGGTFLLALATLFLPIPATWKLSSAEFHSTIAEACLYTFLHISAGILLLLGLKGFKTKLKFAYSAIAIGTMLAGLALAQLPIAAAFDLWKEPWIVSGMAALPLLLSCLIQYAGIRLWARQLQVKSLAMSWWFVVLMVAAVIGLSTLLPRIPTELAESAFDAKIGIFTWIVAFDLFCIRLVWLIKRHASPAYTTAQTWLLWALAADMVALLCGISVELLGTPSYELWKPYVLLDEAFIIGGLLYLRAGYAFNRIGSYEDDRIGSMRVWIRNRWRGKQQPSQNQAEKEGTPFEVITYMANLTSDPRSIDHILDRLRALTSTHQPGKPLTPGEHETLNQIYSAIEDYLTTKEPMREFTPADVHHLVKTKFPPGIVASFASIPPNPSQ